MSLTKLMFLFFLLDYLDFAPLPAADANAKCFQNDFQILKKASIIRGNYNDVASQFNGGLLSSARNNIIHMAGVDNSPLRNSIYPGPLGQGHVDVRLGESIIVQFLQTYQINTVRFWMWDFDNLLTNLQVSTIAADRMTETVIFDNLHTKSTVHVVKFSDQFVSGLKFYNRGGNNVNSDMTLMKIQAFYSF